MLIAGVVLVFTVRLCMQWFSEIDTAFSTVSMVWLFVVFSAISSGGYVLLHALKRNYILAGDLRPVSDHYLLSTYAIQAASYLYDTLRSKNGNHVLDHLRYFAKCGQ